MKDVMRWSCCMFAHLCGRAFNEFTNIFAHLCGRAFNEFIFVNKRNHPHFFDMAQVKAIGYKIDHLL